MSADFASTSKHGVGHFCIELFGRELSTVEANRATREGMSLAARRADRVVMYFLIRVGLLDRMSRYLGLARGEIFLSKRPEWRRSA
jgi:hypothetical protein